MTITEKNRQIWLNFYKSAQAFRDMKPWEWMYDQDMFGVQDPLTGEIGYCIAMGAAGQIFALGVYTGKEGFFSLLKIMETEQSEDIDKMATGLEQKMLKVEFVDRDHMERQELEALKKLGLKFRGKKQWIQAREMLPAYFPGFISDEQAAYLTHTLWQAMDVAERFRENETLLQDEEGKILIRVPRQTEEGLVWEDQYFFEPEEEEKEARKVDPKLIKKAKKELKRQKAALCFSLHYVPNPVKEGPEEDRPFFSKMALWIAYGSAYILGLDIFSPKQFEKDFDKHFFEKLHAIEIIPQQIIVNSDMAFDTIEPITDALDIELIFAPEVEDFQEVIEGMTGMMGGGMF